MGGPPSDVLVATVESVVGGGIVHEEPGLMEMVEDGAGVDTVRDIVPPRH